MQLHVPLLLNFVEIEDKYQILSSAKRVGSDINQYSDAYQILSSMFF